MIKLSSIKLNPNNPRLIKDEKFKQLCNNIQRYPKFLDLRPIVIESEDNPVIIAGNMRFKALQHLGYKEVSPAWIKTAESLTEEERKAFLVIDNVPYGEWDWNTLANEWDTDELIEWGLDIPDFVNKAEAHEDDYVIPDEIETDIVLGDLFEIYDDSQIQKGHRLLCGDSTKAEDVGKLMNGQKADMLFIDPPYGVGYEEKAIRNANKSRGKIINDSDVNSASKVWNGAFKNIADVLGSGAAYYVCAPQGGDQMMMMMMMMQNTIPCKHELIWVKDSPVFSMGRLDYDYMHEPILYGWKGSHKFFSKGQFTKSIWNIPKPKASKLHPTMKPVELIANAINNSTQSENNIVIDFFLGSGTTMVAAHQLNRRCYGMEISPEYCQIIINRMKKLQPDIEIKKNGKPFLQEVKSDA